MANLPSKKNSNQLHPDNNNGSCDKRVEVNPINRSGTPTIFIERQLSLPKEVSGTIIRVRNKKVNDVLRSCVPT